MNRFITHLPFVLFALVCSQAAWAISETGYSENYSRNVLPFLLSGERFAIHPNSKVELVGVRFVHPHARGTVVVLTGRSEPWLKYGEVFYDLHQMGFSVYSYDHRGQGLSTHLSNRNPQIGHILRFEDYVDDLALVTRKVILPSVPVGEPLYLLAHSMGGAIAAGYLERGLNPYRAAVLNSPMLQIDTAPYPESVARVIVLGAMRLGQGGAYALGRGDLIPGFPFEKNDVTHSRARFDMSEQTITRFPSIGVGGPSSEWVYRSLVASREITELSARIRTPLLMLQAGEDHVVLLPRQAQACDLAFDCQLVHYPKARHEILMEVDGIRNRAFEQVDRFFSAH
ncbi:MAG: alpha/beta fold hydrolase [Cryobacterium sp.]|nr:alpha/beta fold hydrolase [Oligoflexia bacterium]